MLIKIAKNGIESEWFQLTKKRHRTLLLEKPDAVFVHIDSLYPKSPESGQIVELSFPCFNLLAREFVLEENRQENKMNGIKTTEPWKISTQGRMVR